MLVLSTVSVGTICNPSASVKAFLGSSVVHSKDPVLFFTCQKGWFSPNFRGILPKTTPLDLVGPVVRIYGLEIVFEDETVLISGSAPDCHP